MEGDAGVFLSAYKCQLENCPGGWQCYARASVSDTYPGYREHAEEEKITFLQEGESVVELCFTSFMDKRSIKGHVMAAHIRIVRDLSLKYSLNQQIMKTEQNKLTTDTDSNTQSLHLALQR